MHATFLAPSNGYAKAVDSLLGKGADIEKSNMEDFTPLYSAAASGYLEVVKTLLAIGTNIEAATYFKKNGRGYIQQQDMVMSILLRCC